MLPPDRKVSRVATVPLAVPSRSAAIRRGATRPWASASRRARAFVITMPSVIHRDTESFRIRSAAPVDVPSTRTRNVPEGRWVLRETFSTERTRIPPTTPATQRRTCSLGNAPVCATPSPSVKGSIAAKLIRDAPTTNRLGRQMGRHTLRLVCASDASMSVKLVQASARVAGRGCGRGSA